MQIVYMKMITKITLFDTGKKKNFSSESLNRIEMNS